VTPPSEKSVVRFEIAPATLGLILAVVAGAWLIRELWVLGLVLLVALVFAGTFKPLIEWMTRHGLQRTVALVVLFFGLIGGTSVLIFFSVPPLLEQLAEIVRGAPAERAELIALLARRTSTLPLAHVVENAGLEQTLARIQSWVLGYWSEAVKVLGYFATTVVLSFYFLADGKRTQGVLYALVPRGYHMRLARILHNLEVIVGGYVRSQLITSAAIAAFTFLLLTVFGVRHALSLALLAGVADVVPFVGGLLAAVPVVLSSLPRGLPVAGAVLVGLFVYMEFENRILVPKLYGRLLRLSPAAVVLALLAGGMLLGMMGALLALPVAAGLQMILEELRVEMPGDDSDDRPERARNAKTEATYERMSAGSTAPEAGQIATDLAHDLRAAAVDAERDLVEQKRALP
jgi:predicted PurR-regulated permease PerM